AGAVVSAPIDPTTTPAWADLARHRDELVPDLRGWFDADPERAQRMSHQLADLHVDLSKNLATDETLSLLVQLAEDVGLRDRIGARLAGVHITATEGRAVLHTALRRPRGVEPRLVVDGQDVDHDVHEVLDKMYAFAEQVRSGEWTGVTGKRV